MRGPSEGVGSSVKEVEIEEVAGEAVRRGGENARSSGEMARIGGEEASEEW